VPVGGGMSSILLASAMKEAIKIKMTLKKPKKNLENLELD